MDYHTKRVPVVLFLAIMVGGWMMMFFSLGNASVLSIGEGTSAFALGGLIGFLCAWAVSQFMRLIDVVPTRHQLDAKERMVLRVLLYVLMALNIAVVSASSSSFPHTLIHRIALLIGGFLGLFWKQVIQLLLRPQPTARSS